MAAAVPGNAMSSTSQIESTPPALQGIAEILRIVIQSEQLAKKADLEILGNRIKAQEDKSLEQGERIAKMELALKNMSEEMARDRVSRTAEAGLQAASYASVASAAAAQAQARPRAAEPAAWTPSHLHVRGFAPYGCAPEHKLSRDAFKDLMDKIIKLRGGT